MAPVFKWLLRIFLLLAAVSFILLLLAYYVATKSLPDYDGSYDFDEVAAPVEIVRDNHNVPHIFGSNDGDVYFGLGFAHAQDRLWQMTILRRTAEGRLSEIFGEATLKIDDFVRRIDIYRLSIASFQHQSEETKHALLSYSAGVNAWLKTVQKEALGRGAPEFFLFSNQIAPWTPADSLAIIRLMSLQMNQNLSSEVLRARISLQVGADRTKDILPDAPGAGVAALPEFSTLFPGLSTPLGPSQYASLHPLDPMRPNGMAGASNAWAAMASRSAANAPILATDPHLGLSAPSIWMLARLDFPDGGVIGGTIPGIPSILIGRSNDLGWGLTSSYLDDLDIYIEKLNPENPNEYLTPSGYKPFKTQDIVINVKDGLPQTRQLRWTENGPVIPQDHYDLHSITPGGHVISIAWSALEIKDRSMSASQKLMRSKSVYQAREAGQMFTAPSQNLVVADKNSIALLLLGKMPKRAENHTSKGRIPSQGWLEQNRWQGYFPFSANPFTSDPASGIVANTNNKITDQPFPKHVSYSWGDSQRIKRLTRLLNGRKVHTRDSFIEAQTDTVSFTARTILPLIARDLWFAATPAPEGTPERQRQVALTLLANWNGEMSEHLPEPLIFAAWLRNLQQKLTEDELGPLSREFAHADPVFIERVYRDIDGASRWCDVQQSTRTETCVDIARAALDQALLELTEQYGNLIDSWRWGQAHQAQHDHEVLGKIPLLSWFTNIRQDTSGGDNTLMRALTSGEAKNPYANVHAAGFRAVYDFSDLNSSVFVISTGQSGHFLSRHYDDLAQLWRRGEYIPMSLDPALARGGAVGITHLRPAQPE